MMAKSEPDVSLAARAAEGQVRWLLRGGNKEAAIAAIQRYFTAGRLARAADRDGRSIASNELLLAVHLLPRGDARRAPLAGLLAALLNDYSAPTIPSGQRLFLMEELRNEAPELPPFATYAAERLASQFLDTETPRPGEPLLEPAGPRDLWKLTSPDRRAIALYRTATVASLLIRLLDERKPSKNARARGHCAGAPGRGRCHRGRRHASRLADRVFAVGSPGSAGVGPPQKSCVPVDGIPGIDGAGGYGAHRRPILSTAVAAGPAENRPGGRRLARIKDAAGFHAPAGGDAVGG